MRVRVVAVVLLASAALDATCEAARASPYFAPGAPSSVECAPCHAREVSAWSNTAHARAWSDKVFIAAYREEPMAFCRGCHAPLSDPAREPDAVGRAEGVSCVQCHARATEHLATRGIARADTAAPDAVRCGGCHQFAFPVDRGEGRALWHTPNPMQNTVREWAASQAIRRGDDCVSCHVTDDHGLDGVGERAFLASAVRVRVHARRERGRWSVVAEVRPASVGHAFPTGDLYRRGRLVAWVDGDASSERERVFARRFEEAPLIDDRGAVVFARRERYDARVPPPGADDTDTVTLSVPARGDAPLRWRFEHWRTRPDIAARQGLRDDEVRSVLFEGTIRTSGERPATETPR